MGHGGSSAVPKREKEALDLFLEDALHLFVPAIAADIDWVQGVTSLDKELQQVAPDSERAAQTVDKLIRIRRLSGDEAWVLVNRSARWFYPMAVFTYAG